MHADVARAAVLQVDVYSFGVVLWELVTGRVPARGKLTDPLVPRDCPQDILHLIRECTHQPPAMRPNMKQCFDRIKVPLASASTFVAVCMGAWR